MMTAENRPMPRDPASGPLYAMYACAVCLALILLCMMLPAQRALAQQPTFRNYSTVQGLPSLETYYAITDRKGYMWFATDHGIAKYDGYSFRVFSTSEGMPDNTIFRLFEDRSGRVWFISYSSKTGYIKDDKVYLYKHNDLLKSLYPNQIIENIFEDNHSNVWVNYDLGDTFKVLMINDKGEVSYPYDSHFLKPDVRTVYVSEDGNCEISGIATAPYVQFVSIETGKNIFSRRSELKNKYHVFWMPVKRKKWIFTDNKVLLLENGVCSTVLSLKGDALYCFVDSSENIWLGYRDIGAEVYYKSDNYHAPGRFLPGKSITCICSDKQGGIWFTSLEKGVFYLPPTHPYGYTHDEGFPVSRTDRLCRVDKNITAVLANKDAVIFDADGKKYTVVKGNPAKTTEIKYRAPDRVFYSGRPGMKLPYGKKQIYLPETQKIVNGKNCIWGLSYLNLTKFDLEGRPLKSVSFQTISRMKCGFEEKNGNLLVGTIDGLYEYDGSTVRALKTRNAVWGNRISDIKRIDNIHLAITTLGAGLMIADENNLDHPLEYTEKQGLPSVMCHVAYPENDTILWVGTNKGLCYITNILSRARAKFVTIDESEGLLSNAVNDIMISGRSVWVATTEGLSILPARPLSISKAMPLYFQNIIAGGKHADKEHPSSISYTDNRISFSYTGVNYMYAGKVQYRYRLLPFDTTWYGTSNRSVTYNSLAPGKYTFELAAVCPSRLNTTSSLSYSFEVLSPFWRTWWFSGLMLASFTLGMYTILHYRVKFIKGQVQMKNDLNSFREKALRAQMNPHFIYNSINSIQSYMVKNEMSPSISYLSKFSKLMRLVFSNTDMALVSLKDDLEALHLYVEMEQLRFPDKFSYAVETDPAVNPEVVQVLPLVIQPFVENAILHGMLTKTSPGHIKVSIAKNAGSLCIRIEDNGIGRKQAAAIKRKKLHYNPEERHAYEKRKSSGITVTSMRIQQAWAKKEEKHALTVTDLYDENEQARGTIIEFNLPLKYD